MFDVERVENGEERWQPIGALDGSTSTMPELSEKQREDILAVSGQRDEDIDYSDIPRFGRSRRMPFVAGSIAVMPSLASSEDTGDTTSN